MHHSIERHIYLAVSNTKYRVFTPQYLAQRILFHEKDPQRKEKKYEDKNSEKAVSKTDMIPLSETNPWEYSECLRM